MAITCCHGLQRHTHLRGVRSGSPRSGTRYSRGINLDRRDSVVPTIRAKRKAAAGVNTNLARVRLFPAAVRVGEDVRKRQGYNTRVMQSGSLQTDSETPSDFVPIVPEAGHTVVTAE